MKISIAMIATTFLAAMASAQSVDVGTARWDRLPLVKARPASLNNADLAGRVAGILGSGQCTLPRQSAQHFDFDVPYAVLLSPDGKAERVLVTELKCRPIEELTGNIVLARSDAGDYLPTGETKSRWYASAVNFNLR